MRMLFRQRSPERTDAAKAVFLDKDGTLVEDVPCNIDPGKMKLTRGCEKGLKLLQSKGYKLIVVSNQPGIAKGYFTIHDMNKAASALFRMISRLGVQLSGFYFCPHHPEGTVENYRISCLCRKPGPGLIEQAAREHGINVQKSWLVGDILNDIEAGRRAGCRTVLIDNGNETEWAPGPQRIPDYVARDLEEAAEIICR